MFVLDEETTVIYPTTVKITLTFVADDDTPIPLTSGSNVIIEITLNDNSGHQYVCRYDSENPQNCQHTTKVDVDPVYNPDDNMLNLLLEGEYNLHGKIYATGKVILPDEDYTAGQDVSYYQCVYTKLNTVEYGCEC